MSISSERRTSIHAWAEADRALAELPDAARHCSIYGRFAAQFEEERKKFEGKGLSKDEAEQFARVCARLAQWGANERGNFDRATRYCERDKSFNLSERPIDAAAGHFGEAESRRRYVDATMRLMPADYFDKPLRPEFEEIRKRLRSVFAGVLVHLDDAERCAADEAYVRQFLRDFPNYGPPPKEAVRVEYAWGER